MSNLLKDLKGKRDGLVVEMRSHLEDAEKRDDGPTADDDAKLRAYDEDIAALDQRMEDIAKVLKRADEVDPDVQRALDAQPDPVKRDAEPTETDRLRSFLKGETRSIEFTSRDLTVGSATAGGNTVPTGFYDQLVEHMIEVSGVRQAGPTVWRTASGEAIQVPTTTAHSTAALTTEGSPISESDPAFAQRTLNAYKYAFTMQISSELLTDTGVDLSGYLARQAGRALGNGFGAHLVTGSGSSQPNGVATAASTGVTGAGTAPTSDELIDLFHSVISPYRSSMSCAWLMRDATVATIRKLKDGDNQYLWQPGLQAGAPDRLLGKPVYVDPNVAATGSSAKSILFGDFAAYFVREVGNVRFERSDDFAFTSDLVTFRAIVRGDGELVDQTGAVKAFVGA